jgi:hypothetical protein
MSYDEQMNYWLLRLQEKKIHVKDISTRIDDVTRLRHVTDVSHDTPSAAIGDDVVVLVCQIRNLPPLATRLTLLIDSRSIA